MFAGQAPNRAVAFKRRPRKIYCRLKGIRPIPVLAPNCPLVARYYKPPPGMRHLPGPVGSAGIGSKGKYLRFRELHGSRIFGAMLDKLAGIQTTSNYLKLLPYSDRKLSTGFASAAFVL